MAQLIIMEGTVITVKARAKAKMREISVDADGIYKIRTPAAPEKNRANEDIVDILADYFGIAKSQVELISGHASSLKKFRILR